MIYLFVHKLQNIIFVSQNEYDLEVFMEYLKITKKTDYNLEKRRLVIDEETKDGDKESKEQDADGFDINRLQYNQSVITLFNNKWSMKYNSDLDGCIVTAFVSYLNTNGFKQCIDNIELRFHSEWVVKWIEEVK